MLAAIIKLSESKKEKKTIKLMGRLLRRTTLGMEGRRESSEDVGENNQKQLEYTCMKSSKNKEISLLKITQTTIMH